MRRTAVQVMSGVTLVVVGLSVRASRNPSYPGLGTQPAGVVAEGGTAQPAAPAPAATRQLAPSRPAPTGQAARLPGATASAARQAVRHSSAPAPPPPHTTAPRPSRSASPRRASVTVNGGPADTQYGPVQVQITLRGGHIVAARAIEYPTDSGRDQEINSYAIPQLNDETVRADSAQIDTVSGATYTSDGYRQSLQSALDAAHRAGAR